MAQPDRVHDVDERVRCCSDMTDRTVWSLNATIADLAARKQTFKRTSACDQLRRH